MWRLLSIREVTTRAREAAIRFPFVILAGAAATVFANVATDAETPDVWVRATLAALLALPAFFALAITFERRPGRGLLLRAAGVLVPLGFFFGAAGTQDRLLWFRFLHLAFAVHLGVALLPFIGRPRGHAFWQYNRILFLRFLVGALFTVVLFGGLALAIASLDPLFGIDVEFEIYPRLFFVLAFLVHPWYFVAGAPADLDALEHDREYPAGLRVFAQFILIPLVTVYLVLLTAYLGRVLLTRTWPSGWIGWLVSGVAVTGTLALLLVHPLREREDSRWVDVYGRWFYAALLPSVGMLLAAIALRIGQYGITEPRWYLLSLALTLAAIALFYAITGSRDIRVIPAVLGVVALLTYVGPVSAYAVTERSQRGRIEDVLARHDLLRDGRAVPARADLPFDDRREISGALRYLIETRGTASVRPLLVPPDAEPDTARMRGWEADRRAADILAALGIEYAGGRGTADFTNFYVTSAGGPGPLDVADWDLLFEADLRSPARGRDVERDVYLADSPAGRVAFRVMRGRVPLAEVILDDEIRAILDDYMVAVGRDGLPADSLTFDMTGDSADVRVHLTTIMGRRSAAGDSVDLAHARVLVRLRNRR